MVNDFRDDPSTYDELYQMIMTLDETIWEGKVRDSLTPWLANFSRSDVGDIEAQKLNALHMLSQFMYFGTNEVRCSLKYMYEHLFKYPTIREIRKQNGGTLKGDFLNNEFDKKLKSTRFLGLGNPSESSYHLLYYFRQENYLHKDLFIHPHQLYSHEVKPKSNILRKTLADENIDTFIFLDDLSASGSQAKRYSGSVLSELKNIYNAENKQCVCIYLLLFGTTEALNTIREKTLFDDVKCVFELDESFKAFSNDSRIFRKAHAQVDHKLCEEISYEYGRHLIGKDEKPHGFGDGQYLFAMSHNTPNNTLPIFWSKKNRWTPIFPRFDKKYSWETNHD